MLVFAILILSSVGIGLWVFQTYPSQSQQRHAGLRAVLIDELSGTIPDPSFINQTQVSLSKAGYTLDYVAPADVTVEYFASLPLKGYDLILIRAHTTAWPAIITSEPYSSAHYQYEQLTDRVVAGGLDKVYFAITPGFVSHEMRGDFGGAIIVVMGCGGPSNLDLANSFLERGATAYIGWDGLVSASHTDAATEAIVGMISQRDTARDAVNQASNSLGPDPIYNGQLTYYDHTIIQDQQVREFLAGLTILLPLIALVVLGPVLVLVLPKLLTLRG